MSTIVVAVFMWLLVLTLLLRARSRPDNTMVKAAVVIAASLTTNINGVYLWASDGLPWPNALDLVSNILLIIGVYYLSRAIVRGAGAGDGSVDRAQRWSAVAAAGTVLVMVVAFCLIDDPHASTTFMLDFGDQPAAGIYSGVQYLYIFAVMARTLSTCIRNVPQMRRRRFRAGFRLIGAGCGVGLVLCTSVIVMDIAHVAGAESLMRAVGTVYDISYALTVVLLATGARARRLPLPGMDLPGVLTLRTAGDAGQLRALMGPEARLVILGAGLIGAETAATARGLGAEVTLVDPAELPFERAVGPEMAGYLHGLHAAHGTGYVRGRAVGIAADGRALSVDLEDGRRLTATAVLVAVGGEPVTALAEDAGLEVDCGILVDRAGRTSHPRVFAAGDSARLRGGGSLSGRHFEHWDAARRTGEAAAAGILADTPPAPGADWFWSDRYGVHLEVAGSLSVPGRTVLRGAPGPGFMTFRVADDGTLAGVAAVDAGTSVRAARRLIESGRAVDPAALADAGADLRRMARARP